MARTAGKVPKAEEVKEDRAAHAEEHARGTMLIMLIYLVLIVVLWGSMFLVMLERS